MSKRVLIARQDSLGDVLLAGPAIRAVAAGGARVTLLCGPRGKAAAELLPGVHETIVERADWIDAEPAPIDPRAIGAFVEGIARHDFEEALILTSFHQSPLPLALLLRMAGMPRIAAISDDYPGSLLDVRHRVSGGMHEAQRALSLTSACGYALPEEDDGSLRIDASAGLHPAAAAVHPYVVVHPGASVSARAWSPRRHRELVRLLVEEGRKAVVTGSVKERELTAGVCADLPLEHVVDLAGEVNLAGLATVIGSAQAIVVGNTGPAHLAAAVGTPVVSIYAPTVPAERWHPWNVPFELLYRDTACAGCRARECPLPAHPCVERITAIEALQAVSRLTRPRPALSLLPSPPELGLPRRSHSRGASDEGTGRLVERMVQRRGWEPRR